VLERGITSRTSPSQLMWTRVGRLGRVGMRPTLEAGGLVD